MSKGQGFVKRPADQTQAPAEIILSAKERRAANRAGGAASRSRVRVMIRTPAFLTTCHWSPGCPRRRRGDRPVSRAPCSRRAFGRCRPAGTRWASPPRTWRPPPSAGLARIGFEQLQLWSDGESCEQPGLHHTHDVPQLVGAHTPPASSARQPHRLSIRFALPRMDAVISEAAQPWLGSAPPGSIRTPAVSSTTRAGYRTVRLQGRVGCRAG